MSEMPENSPRSTLRVALGFLLGILVCVGCLFFSILLGAVLGVRHTWMFPVLNAIALFAAGVVALRSVNKSSYPEGVLIAISVVFIINVFFVAMTWSTYVE